MARAYYASHRVGCRRRRIWDETITLWAKTLLLRMEDQVIIECGVAGTRKLLEKIESYVISMRWLDERHEEILKEGYFYVEQIINFVFSNEDNYVI